MVWSWIGVCETWKNEKTARVPCLCISDLVCPYRSSGWHLNNCEISLDSCSFSLFPLRMKVCHWLLLNNKPQHFSRRQVFWAQEWTVGLPRLWWLLWAEKGLVNKCILKTPVVFSEKDLISFLWYGKRKLNEFWAVSCSMFLPPNTSSRKTWSCFIHEAHSCAKCVHREGRHLLCFPPHWQAWRGCWRWWWIQNCL